MSGERLIYFTAGATAILLAYPYLSVLHDSLQERFGRQPVRYDQPYWGPKLETSAHEKEAISDNLDLIARNRELF